MIAAHHRLPLSQSCKWMKDQEIVRCLEPGHKHLRQGKPCGKPICNPRLSMCRMQSQPCCWMSTELCRQQHGKACWQSGRRLHGAHCSCANDQQPITRSSEHDDASKRDWPQQLLPRFLRSAARCGIRSARSVSERKPQKVVQAPSCDSPSHAGEIGKNRISRHRTICGTHIFETATQCRLVVENEMHLASCHILCRGRFKQPRGSP
mmetsp:Transcript_31480/g.61813  ORF Transcript_31480/g.61813 Transcript_31480/m.61813 type:complete len:207 (+) Transcript_31480:128-748(+)